MQLEKISIQKVLVSVGACLGLTIVASSSVQAEVTIPVESFTGANAVSDNWIAGGFPNSACLTAGNDLARTPIPGCQRPRIDEIGSGVFRLTNADFDQSGYLLYNAPINSRDGLDAFFYASQWGGDGADGIAFFFVDGAYELNAPGGNGGSLGYASKYQHGEDIPQDGVAHGLLGVGFDVYGSYGTTNSDGADCSTPAPGGISNSIGVRGPGNGANGYCWIDGVDLSPLGISLRGDTRAEGAHLFRIRVDSAEVEERKVRIFIDDVKVLTVAVPQEFLDAETVKFGWTAGTGGSTDFHEIWGASVKVVAEPVDYVYEAPTLQDDLEAISSTTTQATEETLVETGAQTNHQPLLGLLALSLGFALVGLSHRRRHG